MKKLDDIRLVRVQNIKPYNKNHRIHNDLQVSRIADSIEEFGFRIPILLDEDNVILSGHGRLLAAQLLDMEEVPCIIVDNLTPEQKKAFRIADNRLSDLSYFDEDLVSAELKELEELNFNIELTGFSSAELKDMLEGWKTDIEAPISDEPFSIGEKEPKDKTATCPKCGCIFEV